MSHFLDRLTFFKRTVGDFSDGHGIVTQEDRRWEDGYRKRWQHDNRPIIRARALNCRTMSRAAARAGQAIPGTSIPATG